MENIVEEKNTERKDNAFVRAMKAIFVHNIGYKVFAVLFGALIWLLAVAL